MQYVFDVDQIRIIRGTKKKKNQLNIPFIDQSMGIKFSPFLSSLSSSLFSFSQLSRMLHDVTHVDIGFLPSKTRPFFRRISLKLEIRLFIQTKVWKGTGDAERDERKFLHGRVARTISPLTGKLFFLARQASYCERQF